MTEAQAHDFFAKWGQRWLGRKPLSEAEALQRMKIGCLLLFLQLIVPLGTELPRIIYPPELENIYWTYTRLIIVTASLVISIFSAWLLIRIWRACKAIGVGF